MNGINDQFCCVHSSSVIMFKSRIDKYVYLIQAGLHIKY